MILPFEEHEIVPEYGVRSEPRTQLLDLPDDIESLPEPQMEILGVFKASANDRR